MDLELAQEVMKERLERYEWNQDRAKMNYQTNHIIVTILLSKLTNYS